MKTSKPMTQQNKMSHSNYNDQAKLDKLCWDAADKIEYIYEYFDVQIKYRNDQVIKSCCPVHGGDNPVACNFYPAGNQVVHWKCRSHNCEDHFGKTMIGFIKGCISRKKYDWSQKGDKEASFKEAIDFLLHITNQNFDSIKVDDHSSIEMSKFSNLVWTMIGEDQQIPDNAITRDFYIRNIDIPAKYYLDRGYSEEVLIKYDVGFCSTKGKQMFDRAIVPIYDASHTYAVGFTGRSVHDKCNKCNYYHSSKDRCKFFPKWKHSKGFNKEKWLYNYWYAKQEICKSKVAVIVESPGNVWRLEEAGIHNSLAIFGTSLNQGQKDLLDQLGALTLIVLMDNDDAGRNAASKIEALCNTTYKVCNLQVPTNDIGEMSKEQVKKFLLPILEKEMNTYGF